jgi:hypothetical protein
LFKGIIKNFRFLYHNLGLEEGHQTSDDEQKDSEWRPHLADFDDVKDENGGDEGGVTWRRRRLGRKVGCD